MLTVDSWDDHLSQARWANLEGHVADAEPDLTDDEREALEHEAEQKAKGRA